MIVTITTRGDRTLTIHSEDEITELHLRYSDTDEKAEVKAEKKTEVKAEKKTEVKAEPKPEEKKTEVKTIEVKPFIPRFSIGIPKHSDDAYGSYKDAYNETDLKYDCPSIRGQYCPEYGSDNQPLPKDVIVGADGRSYPQYDVVGFSGLQPVKYDEDRVRVFLAKRGFPEVKNFKLVSSDDRGGKKFRFTFTKDGEKYNLFLTNTNGNYSGRVEEYGAPTILEQVFRNQLDNRRNFSVGKKVDNSVYNERNKLKSKIQKLVPDEKDEGSSRTKSRRNRKSVMPPIPEEKEKESKSVPDIEEVPTSKPPPLEPSFKSELEARVKEIQAGRPKVEETNWEEVRQEELNQKAKEIEDEWNSFSFF